jgi:hypothetical protein
MIGMTRAARKLKVSVSLDALVLREVDRRANREGASRSAILERWLNNALLDERRSRLEEDTARYYDSLTDSKRADDDAWTQAAARGARELRIDDHRPRKAPRPSARRSRG